MNQGENLSREHFGCNFWQEEEPGWGCDAKGKRRDGLQVIKIITDWGKAEHLLEEPRNFVGNGRGCRIEVGEVCKSCILQWTSNDRSQQLVINYASVFSNSLVRHEHTSVLFTRTNDNEKLFLQASQSCFLNQGNEWNALFLEDLHSTLPCFF